MKCAICGAEFKPYRPHQKYCSRRCYHRAVMRRYVAKNRAAVNLQRKFRRLGKRISIVRARELLK